MIFNKIFYRFIRSSRLYIFVFTSKTDKSTCGRFKTWYRNLLDQKVWLDKSKGGQAASNLTKRQKWVKSTFKFIKPKIAVPLPVKSVRFSFLKNFPPWNAYLLAYLYKKDWKWHACRWTAIVYTEPSVKFLDKTEGNHLRVCLLKTNISLIWNSSPGWNYHWKLMIWTGLSGVDNIG